jgi:hypothetical protein
LEENVEGHAARKDSPEFVHARKTAQTIVGTLTENPWGTGAVQCHHGGSLWVYDGTSWLLYLNWAGIEWSAQFCCDPAKVDELRANAEALTEHFPDTLIELEALGYKDTDILSKTILTPEDIARYVDSIWNSCVPIPQPQHTGTVKARQPLASGVHNYPEPMCSIPRVMHDDFVPFHVDAASQAAAVIVPVAPRGSGDGRARVIYAQPGHPLHTRHEVAHQGGKALILSETHPLAKAAFHLQAK